MTLEPEDDNEVGCVWCAKPIYLAVSRFVARRSRVMHGNGILHCAVDTDRVATAPYVIEEEP